MLFNINTCSRYLRSLKITLPFPYVFRAFQHAAAFLTYLQQTPYENIVTKEAITSFQHNVFDFIKHYHHIFMFYIYICFPFPTADTF